MILKRAIIITGLLLYGALASAATEDCAIIDDPDARLACYDRQSSRAREAKEPETTGAAEENLPAAEQQPEGAVLTSEPVATSPQDVDAPVAEKRSDKAGLFNMDDRVDLTLSLIHI